MLLWYEHTRILCFSLSTCLQSSHLNEMDESIGEPILLLQKNFQTKPSSPTSPSPQMEAALCAVTLLFGELPRYVTKTSLRTLVTCVTVLSLTRL